MKEFETLSDWITPKGFVHGIKIKEFIKKLKDKKIAVDIEGINERVIVIPLIELDELAGKDLI